MTANTKSEIFGHGYETTAMAGAFIFTYPRAVMVDPINAWVFNKIVKPKNLTTCSNDFLNDNDEGGKAPARPSPRPPGILPTDKEADMKLPLQITLRDISHSDAVEEAIRQKAEKLERFYAQIMACRVTVEMPGKHKHQGKEFEVHLDITVPGGEIVVNKMHNEDMHVALRDAFDAAKRQLEDYAQKQRGDVKTHAVAAPVAAEE